MRTTTVDILHLSTEPFFQFIFKLVFVIYVRPESVILIIVPISFLASSGSFLFGMFHVVDYVISQKDNQIETPERETVIK